MIVRQIDLELDDPSKNSHKYYTVVIYYHPGKWGYRVRVKYGRKSGFGSVDTCQVDEKLVTVSILDANEKLYELCAEKRKKGYSLIRDWAPPTSGLDIMLEVLP